MKVFCLIAVLGSAAAASQASSHLHSHLKRDGSNVTSPAFFNGTCTAENVAVRKEWRSLTDDEKKAYISAELCLMALPGQTGLPGAEALYDDFVSVHQHWTNTSDGDIIHFVGQFLPFHRYFAHAHGEMLSTYCNYTDTLPWWDEVLDSESGNFFRSNMWDDDTGFGGNGTGPDHCVTSGPFANRTMHVGPREETTDYCFSRNWDTIGAVNASQAQLDTCFAYDDYDSFNKCLAASPHIAGHAGTGGVMADVAASPGDPLFFLHHNYIDRVWWQWQQANATSRLYAIGGNTTEEEPTTGWVITTLDYVLSTIGIVPNTTVGEVMNIQGGYLCYEYEY